MTFSRKTLIGILTSIAGFSLACTGGGGVLDSILVPANPPGRTIVVQWEAHGGATVTDFALQCEVDSETQGDIAPAVQVYYLGAGLVEAWILEVDSQFRAECTGTVLMGETTLNLFMDDDDSSYPNEDTDPGMVLAVFYALDALGTYENRDFRGRNGELDID